MNFPLTAFEVWKYLITLSYKEEVSSWSLKEVMDCLDEEDSLRGKIGQYRGFYFLKNRQELVAERIIREKISSQKLKKVFRATRFIRMVPFLRMVAVTGRVAMRNAKTESDLDLFVVFQSGRMFTGRLLLTVLTHIMGKRRHGERINDRLCLNYFATEDGLEVVDKDLFASSEYSFILPVFDLGVFEKFQEANRWIEYYRPNFSFPSLPPFRSVRDNLLSKKLRGIGEKLWGWNFLEKALGRWQLGRIAKDPRTKREGSRIIANEKTLLFLPVPQGPIIWERFSEKIGNLSRT